MERAYSVVLPYSTENRAESAKNRPWPLQGSRFRRARQIGRAIIEQWHTPGMTVYCVFDAVTAENLLRHPDGFDTTAESDPLLVAEAVARALGEGSTDLWPMARITPEGEARDIMTSRMRRRPTPLPRKDPLGGARLGGARCSHTSESCEEID